MNIPGTHDPMAARGDAAAALCGPLRQVTIATNDASRTAQFFTQAMCMRLASDAAPSPAQAQAQRALWGLPPTAQWRELIFDHPGVGQGYRLRVIVMGGGALIRPQMESRLAGGLSVGFAVSSLEQTHDRVTALGVGTTAGIVPLVMTRPDGSTYTSGEIHFRGPEDIYALAVGRPPDLAPVGPIDPVTGIGGPAYSAMVVADATREIEFYREVLGWEARRDVVLTTSGPAGGLGLDAGTQFRFVQLFAPGATTAYIVLLDMLGAGRANPVAPRLPNRGLALWTFPTRQLAEVERRLRANRSGASLFAGPQHAVDSSGRVLTALTPAGLMIEVEEQP